MPGFLSPPRLFPRFFPVNILFPALLAGHFFGFDGFDLLGQVREKTAGESVPFSGFGGLFGFRHPRFFGQGWCRETSHGDASSQEKVLTSL